MDVIETRQTPKCAKMDNNYYGSEKDLRGNLMATNIMVIAEFALGYTLTFLLIWGLLYWRIL